MHVYIFYIRFNRTYLSCMTYYMCRFEWVYGVWWSIGLSQDNAYRVFCAPLVGLPEYVTYFKMDRRVFRSDTFLYQHMKYK